MFISGSKSTTFLSALSTYPILYPPNISFQLLKEVLKGFHEFPIQEMIYWMDLGCYHLLVNLNSKFIEIYNPCLQ
jgi:hypothetical protein